MNDIAEPKERKPIQKMTLNSDKVKGLENFSVDDTIEVTLKLKVLKPMGRQVWDKEDMKKPLEGDFEIISGKATSFTDDMEKNIENAESIKELNKAAGHKED